MADKRGGARPGAGRKPRAFRYADTVAAGEAELVGLLPLAVDVLRGALEDGDLGAARLVLTYALGRPAAQGLPLSEDYRLPADHPAAEHIQGQRRRHELALAVSKGVEATTAGVHLLKNENALTRLEFAAEERGAQGMSEVAEQEHAEAKAKLGDSRRPAKKPRAPRSARVTPSAPSSEAPAATGAPALAAE